jgi:hypothetical protein
MTGEPNMDSIDLWTERGKTFAEVVTGIKDRSDDDCIFAADCWFKAMQNQSSDNLTGLKIAEMADRTRDTAKVLSFLEPQSEWTAIPDRIKEMMALTIEGYVRSANSCFPVKPNGHGIN